jgi:hypothetical protein
VLALHVGGLFLAHAAEPAAVFGRAKRPVTDAYHGVEVVDA